MDPVLWNENVYRDGDKESMVCNCTMKTDLKENRVRFTSGSLSVRRITVYDENIL